MNFENKSINVKNVNIASYLFAVEHEKYMGKRFSEIG